MPLKKYTDQGPLLIQPICKDKKRHRKGSYTSQEENKRYGYPKCRMCIHRVMLAVLTFIFKKVNLAVQVFTIVRKIEKMNT